MLNTKEFKQARRWAEPIKIFLESNFELLELSEVTSGAIGDLDSPRNVLEKHVSKAKLSLLGAMDVSFQHELVDVILNANLRATQERKNRKKLKEYGIETPGQEQQENSEKSSEQILEDFDRLVEQFNLDESQQQYALTLFMSGLRLVSRPPKSETKHAEALFAIAIANLELFVSNMMNLYLIECPRGFNMNDLGVTYEQIKQLGSIEELDDLCREKQIDQIMGQNFRKWVNWFSARDKKLIEESNLANFDQISDLILLRNVLLHSGGVVSRRHVEVATNKDWFIKGKKVSLSRMSLGSTLTQLNSFAFSLWFMVVTKIHPQNEHLEALTTDIEVNLLKQQQAKVIVQNQGLIKSRYTSDVLSVNYWLACQHLGKTEYLDAVQKWNPNSEDTMLLLAKEILLGNLESASLTATEMLRTRELRVYEWLEWPLFAALRNSNFVDQQLLE